MNDSFSVFLDSLHQLLYDVVIYFQIEHNTLGSEMTTVMKNFIKKAFEYWYLIIMAVLLLTEGIVFFGFGDKSYITVHDNLDLFIPHLKMLKHTGTFFTQGDTLPILGGVTRNDFGSEFYLYNLLFAFLPAYYAYIAGYFLSIAVSMISVYLLAKEILPDYKTYRPFILLFGMLYGILPVFPTYGLAFASIPLVILILCKIYRTKNICYYILLFFYPIVSYFSYFGFFILGYLVLFTIGDWIHKKKPNIRLLIAIPVLFAGYALLEYRLFSSMLFDDTVTIRSTMYMGDLNFREIMNTIWDGFFNSTFHAGDSHKYFVLPVVLLYLIIQNFLYIKRKEWGKITSDISNLLFLFILFNCVIYGIYYFKPLRDLITKLIPPLEGFQYYRTIFFNPFLWYALLFLIVKRLYEKGLHNRKLSNTKTFVFKLSACAISIFSILVVVFTPANYNDFYYTCYYNAYQLIKQKPVDMLNYHEFYSEDLFTLIKEDIDYNGEYAAAYGFHPAVLTYNGISTLDGYLGMYSQEYKENFRKIIAPALERSDYYRNYFDTWGARAYIFPGFDGNSYLPSRNLTLPDSKLYIDTDAFKALHGVYLFSRFEISNAKEIALSLVGEYTEESSPYVIYVYRAD